MRIAVASRDGKKVSGHIGKCADWIVFDIQSSDEQIPVVKEAKRIKLDKEFVFHHYKDEKPHPLADCNAVIGASAGESFVSKMAKRGIEAVLTAEADPAKAVSDYIQDTLAPAKPRPVGEIICKIRDAFSSEH